MKITKRGIEFTVPMSEREWDGFLTRASVMMVAVVAVVAVVITVTILATR